jgi:hypothetical protein
MSFILDIRGDWNREFESKNPEPDISYPCTTEEMFEHVAWLDLRWNTYKHAFSDKL